MQPQLNYLALLPEITVLTFACITILAELFLSKKLKSIVYYLVQFTLICAASITIAHFGGPKVVSFNGTFVNDQIAQVLKLFIYIAAFGAFLYSRLYIQERNMPSGDYYILGLFSTLGMMVLVSAHSFITIYIGLELLALPIYAMVALRRDNALASEASMKYFIMGAMASGMLLYGMSMLYGATGNLDIQAVANSIAKIPQDKTLILSFGLVFIVAGLGFKFAAAPFHMWAPDVYTGAPSSVTLFLGTAPKVAALGMAFRLLVIALPKLGVQWQELLIVLSILSMGFGNLLAIAQSNIKRMLAYSGIAHIGFMLLGLLANTKDGYAASMFYIVIYSLMSLGAFGMIVLLSRSGYEAENIEDFKGLNSRNPWLAFMMLIIMFSMAGVPPTVGFLAKLLVLKAVINVHLVWLAALAVVFAIMGAFYYIRIIKTMYFDAPAITKPAEYSFDMQLAISVNGLALLGLGLFPGALMHLCRVAFGV